MDVDVYFLIGITDEDNELAVDKKDVSDISQKHKLTESENEGSGIGPKIFCIVVNWVWFALFSETFPTQRLFAESIDLLITLPGKQLLHYLISNIIFALGCLKKNEI